jgi:hypothetical protein
MSTSARSVGRIVSRFNKYRNTPVVIAGRKFASKREASRYADLVLLENAGRIRGLECQQRYRLEVAGQLVCTYIADFVYDERRGMAWIPIVEDCKGFRTAIYKLKKKFMKACHNIEIRET